jgi:hypothetical protein
VEAAEIVATPDRLQVINPAAVVAYLSDTPLDMGYVIPYI